MTKVDQDVRLDIENSTLIVDGAEHRITDWMDDAGRACSPELASFILFVDGGQFRAANISGLAVRSHLMGEGE